MIVKEGMSSINRFKGIYEVGKRIINFGFKICNIG